MWADAARQSDHVELQHLLVARRSRGTDDPGLFTVQDAVATQQNIDQADSYSSSCSVHSIGLKTYTGWSKKVVHFSSTSTYITIVKKLHFFHENTTCLHRKPKPHKLYEKMKSFNDKNTQVNQNCNYNASNRVGNSNAKSVPFFETPVECSQANTLNLNFSFSGRRGNKLKIYHDHVRCNLRKYSFSADIYRPTWNSPPNSAMEAAPISYLKNSFKIGLW